MFQELHKPILDSKVNKWYIAAKGVGAVLTINNEIVMIYNSSVLDWYYETEAIAFRALHLYYDSNGKGYDFPYHDEFMEAHNMAGLILVDVKSEVMRFE